MYSKLQYISRGETSEIQFQNIQNALENGCSWIQLRFKKAGYEELLELAGKVKVLCCEYSATFIINDHVQIAREIDADGVHLGLQDMPVSKARSILGPDKIIGGTANTTEDVQLRIKEKCNYIGLGPFRFTETKENLSPVLGVDGYEQVLSEFTSATSEIPIYAIGGITVNDINTLMKVGVHGVAMSGAITNKLGETSLIKQINSMLYGNS